MHIVVYYIWHHAGKPFGYINEHYDGMTVDEAHEFMAEYQSSWIVPGTLGPTQD